MIAKVDYFGIADNTAVVVTDDDQGVSATTLEAKGQDGAFVACQVFGEKMAPSCDYKMKGAWTIAPGSEKKLGKVTEVDGKSFALIELAISTSNSDIPTISAKGNQVEDNAADGRTFKIPAFDLAKKAHAQILWNAFTLTGAGCHLQSANYTASAALVQAEKDGVPLAFDVAEGKIEAEVEILQVGETEPILEAGEGWYITDPLSCANADSNNPTWKAKLVKHLEKDS